MKLSSFIPRVGILSRVLHVTIAGNQSHDLLRPLSGRRELWGLVFAE